MKKLLLVLIPALALSACKQQQYVVNETAFCSGLEETSEEHVLCKDANGNLLNGLVVQYYSNGNKWREMTIKKGLENGPEKEYYENGNLKVSAMVKNGAPHGTSELYHENGQLHMIIKWHGAEAEIVKIFDESGNEIKPLVD